ncbi:MAG: hypothetical protein GX446_00440 [Chthonomonadales bacterium]|nr:hypothetical protein [Chthonomonadales bacterium]
MRVLFFAGAAVALLAPLRYGQEDNNLVVNGDFTRISDGRPVGWEASGDPQRVQQTLSAVRDGGRTCARLTCTRIDGEGGAIHAMIAQVGTVRLREGALYEFACRARQEGMRGRSVSVAVSDTSTWANCGLYRSLGLDEQWRTFRFHFRASRSVESASRLQFWFLETGTLFLSDVSIRPAAMDQVEFTDVVPSRSGPNMLRNGSFEVGGAGWSTLGTNVGWGNLAHLHGTIVRGADPEHPHFLRVPMGRGRAPVLGFDYFEPVTRLQTRALAASRGWIPVDRGKAYCIQADMRASEDGVPALIGWYGLDPDRPGWDYRHEWKKVTLTRRWETYSVSLSPPARYVFVTVGPDLQDERSVDVDVDNVALTGQVAPMLPAMFTHAEVAVEPAAPGGAYVAGRPVVLVVRGSNPDDAPRSVRITLSAEDYFGATTALRPVTFRVPAKSEAETRVTLPASLRGWYSIRVGASSDGAAPCSLVTPLVRISIVPEPKGPTVLGINHAFPDSWLIPIARMAGISEYRDWSLKWEHIEPRPGEYRWQLADAQIDRVLAAGASVMALLPPFPSAEWSSTAPASLRTPGYPGERLRQAFAPADPAKLADFAGRAVARYRDRVRVWEFLNEPIYTDYSLPRRLYKPADYVALLRPVAAAIRRSDSRARVVGGAGAGASGVTQEMIEAGLLDVVDVLNLHMYPGSRAPEGYIAEMDRLLREMDRRGERKPIWITEFSYYGTDNLPREPFVPASNDWAEERLLASEQECADYTVRFCAIMLARGCEKVFIHSGSSGAINAPAFECCLFDQGGAPRKAASALGVMASMLGPSPRPAPVPRTPEGVFAGAFETAQRSVAMLWATAPGRRAHIPKGVRCFDLMGRTLSGSSVRLSGSPVYLVGVPGQADRLVRF